MFLSLQTIIESGLMFPMPIPFFINNANNFDCLICIKCADVWVEATKKAFCYFICPPYSAMTEDARKRIQALEQF
jgi:transcription-repair coupling factor (superfamily II helicase)